MQMIGIYLAKADERVRKVLKEGEWYSFGDFLEDCNLHKIFFENNNLREVFDENKIEQANNKINQVKNTIKDNQTFINKLYDLDSLDGET